MFSKLEQLHRRTGKKGVGRYDYLQQLVTEFEDTNSTGYVQCREGSLGDETRQQDQEKRKIYRKYLGTYITLWWCACVWLHACPQMKILSYLPSLPHVFNYIESKKGTRARIVIIKNRILIVAEITTPEIVDCIFRLSRSRNTRLRNLATIFLEDYCTTEQVTETREIHSQSMDVANIPLPKN
ncbi:hypothetical protein ANN_24874 [Periplaneta americana]|uniref:Uncharacterized protein n=1 Tax=Periplaneta americana TaxID=6978 RepID=A0ABQ8RZT8_PERAM|nr:hypothetical protein ANN_24874 [Periplaneta americana]